jgi:hypothetical protein
MNITRYGSSVLCLVGLLALMPTALAARPPPPVTVPSEDQLASSDDNLSLKRDLDQRREALMARYNDLMAQADAYDQQYAGHQFDVDSPEAAASEAEYARLSQLMQAFLADDETFKADVAKLVLKPSPPPVSSRVNLYFDMRTLLARQEPKYDVSKIQAEIDGVKAALERLNAVRENNAARIEEWQKASEKASHDAWEMGANMSVDLLTSALKNRADALDKQLQKEADLLAGETDPARRKAIQDTFKELNDHKEQLKKAQEAAEAAHQQVDRLGKLDEATNDEEASEELHSTSEKVSEALNQAWELYDSTGAPLPEGAKEAKQMVDAVYLTAVQVVAVGQINAANYDAEQYLKAVTSLSRQYKKLVDLKNAAQNQSPPQLISPNKVILQRPTD